MRYVVVLLFAVAVVFAEPAPPQDELFPLSKVHPGMHGKAYTVMQGSEVVSINVEIFGVLHDFIGPQKHLIVGKLVDEKTKLTGAVHGMSGSPLYIDNKLVGALSYRLTQFEKEGWCGFTPIADMLEAGEPQTPDKVIATADASPAGPPALSLCNNTPLAVGNAAQSNFQMRPVDFTGFRPLALPVTIAGLNPKVFDWLYGKLAASSFDSHLLPVMGGGGEENRPLDGAFEPGSPVAGVLASGDLHAAGTGTLTWRHGNRVLGFGHPFLQAGKLTMPMARAEIVATISSYLMPHKLSNTRQIIGTITQDRLTAIAGEIGPIPPMTEMTVRVNSPRGERTFRSRLFQHQDLLPSIAASCVGHATMDTLEYSREFTTHLHGDIRLKDHSTIHVEDLYSGGGNDHMELLNDFQSVVSELFANRFEVPQIESINIQAEVKEERHTIEIGDASIDRDTAKPGEPVTVNVALKPWRGPVQMQSLRFSLPEDVRSGELDIFVGDADSADKLDGKINRQHSERAQNLDQLVNILNKRRPQNAIYLRVMRKADGLVLADQRMPSLPPSAMALYDSSRTVIEATRIASADVLEQSKTMDSVVRGSRTLKLRIE